MALITLCISIYIFCLACGAFGSFFVFLIDVIRWHRAEKRVVVSASAQKLPENFKEVKTDERGNSNASSERGADSSSDGSSSGDSNGDSHRDSGSGISSNTGTESNKRDASALFDSWLQP